MTGFDHSTLATLKFEPKKLESLPEKADRVEVTLVTDSATYERLAPELNTLICAFDLVSHVRRAG